MAADLIFKPGPVNTTPHASSNFIERFVNFRQAIIHCPSCFTLQPGDPNNVAAAERGTALLIALGQESLCSGQASFWHDRPQYRIRRQGHTWAAPSLPHQPQKSSFTMTVAILRSVEIFLSSSSFDVGICDVPEICVT